MATKKYKVTVEKIYRAQIEIEYDQDKIFNDIDTEEMKKIIEPCANAEWELDETNIRTITDENGDNVYED